MQKLAYLLTLSSFFLIHSHGAYAGKDLDLQDEKSSHVAPKHAQPLYVAPEWIPQAPFKPSYREYYEKLVATDPNLKLEGNTLWRRAKTQS